MKKFLAYILMIAILFLVVIPFNTVCAEIAGPVEVGSLVEENFSFLFNADDGSGQLVSGWDIDKKGGNIASAYSQWFKVNDTSNTYPITLNKQFAIQNSGKITFETRFNPATIIDGISFQLRNGVVPAFEILTESGNISYKNVNGQTVSLRSYEAAKDVGLKVDVDISSHTMDIYLDGIKYANSVVFDPSISVLDNVFVTSGAQSTGTFTLYTIRVYKGYRVHERFLSSVPTTFPSSQWQLAGAGGTANIQKMPCATEPDTYSLVLTDTSSSANITAYKQFDNINGTVVFEYKFYMPVLINTRLAKISYGSSDAMEITTTNGYINYVSPTSEEVSVVDFKQKIWYHVKVVINTELQKSEIYINGKNKLQNIDLKNSVNSLNKVSFSSSDGGTGAVWLDDILVYKQPAEPTNYVPQPQPVFSPDSVIGIQNCSLWREGSHYGWDRINGFPERKPYLGYYDEGSSEVADWEIKWLTEHGINYQLYCWFRPATGVNNPIKDPYLNYGLHDGYFNAKYSNLMKFSIMWENMASRALNSADFRNNIVPYWVEYYLKDSRYMVFNNKPVISFYSLAGLKRDFGTLAQVKAEMDYLRSVCKELGFDDAIIMTCSSSTITDNINEIKEAGIDCVYAYSWGASHISTQQDKMLKQKNLGIDVVPTISMGKSEEAWRRAPGLYVTPNDFRKLIQWVKDTFAPSLSTGSIGSKMVLLDNWNEFGEGHFIMPSGLQGFNYLDSIRSVYIGESAHTDVVPNAEQKSRINTFYPQDRIVDVPVKTEAPKELYKKKQWKFDAGVEGWSVAVSVRNFAASNGKLNGTATSDDPAIQSENNLNIDINNSSYLVIKMKNSTSSVIGQVYFQTVGDGSYTEEKSVQFFLNTNDSDYTEYVIDMKKNALWTGTLKRLRMDPSAATGNFSIDSIELTENILIKTGSNIITDGSFEGMTVPGGYATDRSIYMKDYQSGYRSLSVTKVSSTYGSFIFPIHSINNRESFYYSLSAKLPPGSVAGVNAGSKATLCIEYKLNGTNVQKVISKSDILSDTKWVKLSGIYTIDENGTVEKPSIYVFSDSPAMLDTVYYDDVEIRPLSVEFESNALSNPSEVAINSNIDIGFDVDIDNATFIQSNILLNGIVAAVNSVFNGSPNNRDFSIDFSTDFQNDKNYILSIKNLKTLDGQSLPYVYRQFTTAPQYSVFGQKFYKNYGQPDEIEIDRISVGEITAIATFSNNTDDSVPVLIAVALYENDVLKTIKIIQDSAEGFQTVNLSSTVNVDENGINYSIKQFVWGGMDTLKAYSRYAELN